MSHRIASLLACCLITVALSPLSADEPPKPTQISGVFVSQQTQEMAANAKQLTSLKLQKILPHGTQVEAGQTVVWFETKDVDERLQKARRALRSAELQLEQDQLQHRIAAETRKLDRAQADRKLKTAQQTYDNFTRVDRERQIASAKFSLKSSEASLANAMEEYTQLKQMYEEDELTEESEEIVLKRAKQAVESAEFRLAGTQVSTQRTIKQAVPRAAAEQRDALTRAELALEKARRSQRLAAQQAELELAGKKVAFEKSTRELDELKLDRRALTLTAKHAGVLYHGQLNRGKLSEKPSSLRPGASVTAKQVLATVCGTKLSVQVDVPAKYRSRFVAGAAVSIQTEAAPDLKLNGKVQSISAYPISNGKFACQIKIKQPKDNVVVPGMSCKITVPEGS